MHPREDAAQKGLRKYHGKPCMHCGGTERWTINATCTACAGDKAREYAKNRREQIKSMLEGKQ